VGKKTVSIRPGLLIMMGRRKRVSGVSISALESIRVLVQAEY
jgi:hypothetical protein